MHLTEQGKRMREQIVEDQALEGQGVEVTDRLCYLRARAGDGDLQHSVVLLG